MRLKIPMTGTVKSYDARLEALDGIGISGDNNDPLKPVKIDLGGVSWHLVGIDLENDLMEVEVEAQERIDVPVLDGEGKQVLKDGKPMFTNRPTTPAEKEQILLNAQLTLASHTADEIYSLTGDKRPIKPAIVLEKYREKHGVPAG